MGRQRGAGLGGGHDEREQTLNQLLVEMDGFDPNAGVILIAATNRPDVLDPALLRPGRFDRRVVVDNPDVNGRREILEVHTKGKPMSDDVDAGPAGAAHARLHRRGPGEPGERGRPAGGARGTRRRSRCVDFEASIDRVIAGPEREAASSPTRRSGVVAYHEVGHAIVLELLRARRPGPQGDDPSTRPAALGSTMQLADGRPLSLVAQRAAG